ncbi:MAG: cupin domain-containing protein [Planctomycetota bacterium]|nr:MAG: cupin domain-containing protein [Planctomycetota bacterium]
MILPIRRLLLALGLAPVLLAPPGCQTTAPDFRYRNETAWVADHPPAGGEAESEVWRAPDADLRLWALPAGVGEHLHRDREEWLFVVAGHGRLRVGPPGAGFPTRAADWRSYPLEPGDAFLLPRRTAHAVEGAVALRALFSPPQPAEFDVVFPATGPDQSDSTSSSHSRPPQRKR